VQHALFDRSASVRNLAIRVLGGPSADLLARAWQMLGDTASTPTQQASALILLADLGLPEGRALALQALAHPVAMVRAAAYSAAFRLGADDPDALILRALDDPSNAVFRVVLRWANRLSTRPTRDVLQHGLAHASATRWHRVLALSDTGLWEMLTLLLQVPPALTRAGQDREWLDRHTDTALQSLQACVNSPSASEAAAITARLDQASRVFGGHASAMRRLLKGFGVPTA
jgi:HEAT repeat protein